MDYDGYVGDMREKIADAQHKIWGHWISYMSRLCSVNRDGDMVIPAGLVKRWKKQMETDYEDLLEGEKEGDREMADKVIECLKFGG